MGQGKTESEGAVREVEMGRGSVRKTSEEGGISWNEDGVAQEVFWMAESGF